MATMTAYAAWSPQRPAAIGVVTALSVAIAARSRSGPTSAVQSTSGAIRYENRVVNSPPRRQRTAAPSARRSVAAYSRRSGQRAVELTGRPSIPGSWGTWILGRGVAASAAGGTSNAAQRGVTMRLGPEHDQDVDDAPDHAESGPQTMAELLAEVEREEQAFRPLRSGETVEGTVAGITGDEVLVDL